MKYVVKFRTRFKVYNSEELEEAYKKELLSDFSYGISSSEKKIIMFRYTSETVSYSKRMLKIAREIKKLRDDISAYNTINDISRNSAKSNTLLSEIENLFDIPIMIAYIEADYYKEILEYTLSNKFKVNKNPDIKKAPYNEFLQILKENNTECQYFESSPIRRTCFIKDQDEALILKLTKNKKRIIKI
jgi:hypothetical protein